MKYNFLKIKYIFIDKIDDSSMYVFSKNKNCDFFGRMFFDLYK